MLIRRMYMVNEASAVVGTFLPAAYYVENEKTSAGFWFINR